MATNAKFKSTLAYTEEARPLVGTAPPAPQKKSCSCCKCLGLFLLAVVCLAGGFLIGWYAPWQNNPAALNTSTPAPSKAPDLNVRDALFSNILADNIRNNHRRFTDRPHLSGTVGGKEVADMVYNDWLDQGLDHVKQEVYNVLMSYPSADDPSRVQLLDSSSDGAGAVRFTSQLREANLTAEQNRPDIAAPYNSHSPPGDVRGPLVFVNYGRIDDFKLLRDTYNINFTGSIAIVKYGKIFRADKVTFAHQFGCDGVIIYSDPADYTGGPGEPTYPDSWWLPPTGVQRGAAFSLKGDPLTPGYPAIDSAYRWPEDQVEGLPKIPVHPISYGDAEVLLREMGGVEAPAAWQGGLPITYRIGPEMANPNRTVRLYVTTSNQPADIINVIGVIRGSVEPDRYVVVGNHRDAWVFGGIDPNSGTAVMMEVSRAYMDLVRRGVWRPRRSIIFCSWGAEEQGLFGSYEWVEHYVSTLGARAVTYLNLDSPVEGNHSFNPAGVPMMHDLLYSITKQIESPNDASITLYDEWLAANTDQTSAKPKVKALGAGSDMAAFINTVGVSSVDLGYSYDPKLGLSSTPCYHSAYETFHLFSTFIDPEFKYSVTMGKVVAELIHVMSESTLLPFNVEAYADAIVTYVDAVEAQSGQLLANNNVSLVLLRTAVDELQLTARDYQQRLRTLNTTSELEIRMYNDQMMQFERAFIDLNGVPLQSLYKNLIAAPSKQDSYSSSAFPGLSNLLFEIGEAPDSAQSNGRWEDVKRHVATLTFVVRSATTVLKPVTRFN